MAFTYNEIAGRSVALLVLDFIIIVQLNYVFAPRLGILRRI